MQPFLDKTAQYLTEHHTGHLEELCLVLPNRRAGLFFKKYLANYISKPTWIPAIFSIEDFIYKASGFQKSDMISMVIALYNIHLQIEGEKAQSFESFLNWGHMLLLDFNEIDQYLADAKQLFSYLSDSKALAVWNLNLKPLTDYEKDYIRFYNSLYDYYKLLKENLLKQRSVYQGMACRKVADEISEMVFDYRKIIFAGFNALSSSEEKIINYLVNSGKAEILWDADNYYVDNPVQEAGKFIRSHLKYFRSEAIRWKEDYFSTGSKKIIVTGVPQQIGQVKLCGQLIKEISTSEEPEETAVVLADESLLMPLLNSLPENIPGFNITMGLALKNTPLFELFDAILTLHENAEKQNGSYYFKDILRILDHNYIQKFIKKNPEASQNLPVNQTIRKSNKVYYCSENLENTFISSGYEFESIRNLFEPENQLSFNLTSNLLKFISSLKEVLIADQMKQNTRSNHIELEYLYYFSNVFKKLYDTIKDKDFITSIKPLRKLFRLISNSISIPFYGEPLQGIQVMGMLETRTLDFRNIIMLSANEGIIPSGKLHHSFIPFDIKTKFKLPTYNEKEAIFAYHFYRLLQRGKNIHLLYNTESDNLGGGDKSRFITQILHEMPHYNPEIIIEEKVLSVPPLKDMALYEIEVCKTKAVMKKLTDKTSQGFSPTSLARYINCGLQFYFHDIAGLRESEEVEETLESSTLGSIIHKVLYNLYVPYVNIRLEPDHIRQMLARAEEIVINAFTEEYREGDITSGKNYLMLNVVNDVVGNYLKQELKNLSGENAGNNSLIIKNLEKKLEHKIRCILHGNEFGILVKGTADRIDNFNGNHRIVDYKTGNINESELKPDSWESLFTNKKYSKSLQLLIYTYLFSREMKGSISLPVIDSGIISLRNPSKGFMAVKHPYTENPGMSEIDTFEKELVNIFRNIFDTNIPFLQTEDYEVCRLCNFRTICNR